MKKKILIINQAQFGYHLDTYYYCKYLKNDFDITYICWDYEKKSNTIKNINIKNISRKGNLVFRNIRFISCVLKEINNFKYDIHFVKYFRGCSILKLVFQSKQYIFDVRSGSVSNNEIKRFLYDKTLRFESKFFNKISVISKSLRDRLNLNKDKSFILPLGAEAISNINKKFNEINLIYVGTFDNRNLSQTIKGFSKFYQMYNRNITISYTIIGTGRDNEIQKIKKALEEEQLTNVVSIIGFVHHKYIKQYFDIANIGVSYIPMTDFFDVQPPTKTFEYLLSGMVTIATSTQENKKIITRENGILIKDNAEEFYKGLKEIYNNAKTYNSRTIKKSVEQYTWKNIVNNFKGYIDHL